jgi:hypothetical protein
MRHHPVEVPGGVGHRSAAEADVPGDREADQVGDQDRVVVLVIARLERAVDELERHRDLFLQERLIGAERVLEPHPLVRILSGRADGRRHAASRPARRCGR